MNTKSTICLHLNKCSCFIPLRLIQPQVTQFDSSIRVQSSFPVRLFHLIDDDRFVHFSFHSGSCSHDHFWCPFSRSDGHSTHVVQPLTARDDHCMHGRGALLLSTWQREQHDGWNVDCFFFHKNAGCFVNVLSNSFLTVLLPLIRMFCFISLCVCYLPTPTYKSFLFYFCKVLKKKPFGKTLGQLCLLVSLY